MSQAGRASSSNIATSVNRFLNAMAQHLRVTQPAAVGPFVIFPAVAISLVFRIKLAIDGGPAFLASEARAATSRKITSSDLAGDPD